MTIRRHPTIEDVRQGREAPPPAALRVAVQPDPGRSRTPQTASRAAEADAAGVGEVVFEVPAIDGWWEVGLISVTSDSSNATEARAYVGEVAERNRVAGTGSGNLDDADMINPIIVPGGSRLIVRWTNATAGALCEAAVQAVEVR